MDTALVWILGAVVVALVAVVASLAATPRSRRDRREQSRAGRELRAATSGRRGGDSAVARVDAARARSRAIDADLEERQREAIIEEHGLALAQRRQEQRDAARRRA